MVDGIAELPLPGCVVQPEREESIELAPGHFLAGPENRLVEVAVRSVVDAPDACYNPLVLCGPSGTGKSHVARGLAAMWKSRNRRRRVVCSTAVEFAQELAEAVESQAVEEFRTKYREAELLVIEDLHQLVREKSDKLSAQEELVHVLDALVAEDRWVIVTTSTPPVELPSLSPMLQSRLAAGLAIPLVPPGPAARRAVLAQLASMHGIQLSEQVTNALADGFPGTVPELAGAMKQLIAMSGFDDKPIDLQGVRCLLSQIDGKQPTMHHIALATAKYFRLRLSELRSSVRRRALVTARGVAVYLARNWAGLSLQEIGSYFGGRDHTTVMHNCRKTEELLQTDPAIHEAVATLRSELWKT